MYVIAGLGNPGREYRDTRHNTGFMVLAELSRITGIAVESRRFQGKIGAGRFQGQSLILLKPRTYMNLSGQAVAAGLAYYKLTPESLIVIHDELDLPLGKIKIKQKGGDGGHRGIRSIIENLHTDRFIRVRIGIGRPLPHDDPVDFVLTPFSKDELPLIQPALDQAASAVIAIITQGLESAMRQFHKPERKTPLKTEDP